ncbi:glycosyltransferase family 2 protein [Brasilonema octagenarum]|uniref:Glycosyltransferase family 2 protein n=1 Tax=Brasilonema octagenarum UFV-OR1 TaxID=417115 RepID=A0ABX1MAX2_9CYAN|nr:glycosyltransferase family 2 protein [Brasilonema octagenarum]NMF64651.1 glycosyltransferase family 2 protein [Brasilonema octagenarum UFV-OR1]
MKKISVIIPVYKVEKYVAATIQSVLEQTYTNFELLIIDDGSPDKSIEIFQQFTDNRIKIIRQENRGVAAARNVGIRHAQGEYLAFLDADDLWVPEKLEKHVEHLKKSPAVGVSFCRSSLIDEAGKPLGIYQITKLKEITPLDILCRTPIGNGSVPVIRRQVFEDIAFQDNLYGVVENFYFDDDRQLHPSEDVELWLRIAMKTKWLIEGIPEALTLYRINSQGFSAQLVKKLSSWETMLEKARAYVPAASMAELEKIAMAYQLRHLARRAVTLEAGSTAVEFAVRSLSTHWRIILEEPHRTIITLAAAYFLWLMPRKLYHQVQSVALKIAGASQKRRIQQEEFGKKPYSVVLKDV